MTKVDIELLGQLKNIAWVRVIQILFHPYIAGFMCLGGNQSDHSFAAVGLKAILGACEKYTFCLQCILPILLVLIELT